MQRPTIRRTDRSSSAAGFTPSSKRRVMPAMSLSRAIRNIRPRRSPIVVGDCGRVLITTKTRQESERAPFFFGAKCWHKPFQILHSKPSRGTNTTPVHYLLSVCSRMQSILHVPDPSSLVRSDAFKPCLHGTLPPLSLAQWHRTSPLIIYLLYTPLYTPLIPTCLPSKRAVPDLFDLGRSR